MIQRLHRELGIPAEALLAPPSVRPAKTRKRSAPNKRPARRDPPSTRQSSP
jgi:hypothetical protein